MVSQYSSNLHIFYYEWSRAYFQMFKSHLYFIFCELFSYLLPSFSYQLVVLLFLHLWELFMLGKLAFSLYMSCKYFIIVCGFFQLLTLLMNVCVCVCYLSCKNIYFYIFRLTNIFFYCLWILNQFFKKSLSIPKIKIIFRFF